MNTTLEQVKPETIAIIELRARLTGLSVDDYLRSLLPADEKDMSLRSDSIDEEFEADMITFADEANETKDLPAYNGTYSRKDIYFDHD